MTVRDPSALLRSAKALDLATSRRQRRMARVVGRGQRPTVCTHLRSPTSAAGATLFSLEYQAVARPLLHEVGKSLPPGEDPGVAGEARRMGCGMQECVVEGPLLWSRKPAGPEAAAHTPSGAS